MNRKLFLNHLMDRSQVSTNQTREMQAREGLRSIRCASAARTKRVRDA